MLRRASEHMKHDSRKKSRKHHALKFNPGANPMTGADLGGFNNAGSFRGGQSIGQGGGPQVGDWPYNGRQDARKSKHAHKAHKRSHKARKHHSVMGLSESRKHHSHSSHKSHKARHHAKAYRGGTPTQGEFGKGLHLSKRSHGARKHSRHHAHKLPHLKPKGKIGRAQTGRLNRNFKTGGFNKVARSAGKEYGSTAAGKRVAGAIFHKMAQARGNAAHKGKHAHKRSRKSYAHKGHSHRSRKAMKEC